MTRSTLDLTPLPADYYRRIHEVELRHWWHRGMLGIEAMLLRDRIRGGRLGLLDAGCGTGGFLAWANGTGQFDRLCGFDVSAEAVALTHARVPTATVVVGTAASIAQPDASIDVLTCNDVLQHIHDDELSASVLELVRVVKPGGTVLVRTNGARRPDAPLPDWRRFDPATLRALLEDAGLRVDRLTHANILLSLWATTRGRGPKPPGEHTHGIPSVPGVVPSSIGRALLSGERRYLRRNGRALPYGHTLIALATRVD